MKPLFSAKPGIYELLWPDNKIRVVLERFADTKQGISAEIIVGMDQPGAAKHLHHSRLNLLSTSARLTLVKQLKERLDNVDWSTMIEQATVMSLAAYRQGEPVVEVWSDSPSHPPKYLLYPIIPLRHPVIIFGEPGVGKGYLALLFAILVGLPWPDNPFGLRTMEEPTPTLYLDWEDNQENFLWRLQCLQKGLVIPPISIYYRRCYRALDDDLFEINQIIADKNIGLTVVDSIAGACGGDLNNPQIASHFFSHELRQLNCTSLSVAHHAKNPGGAKTPFGSIFFTAYSRSVWEVRKHQEMEEDTLNLGVFWHKGNLAGRLMPVGLSLTFGDDEIQVTSLKVKDVPELAKGLPVRVQLTGLLGRGPMAVSDMAEELQVSEATVRMTLNRYKQQFVKVGDKWGLLQRDVD